MVWQAHDLSYADDAMRTLVLKNGLSVILKPDSSNNIVAATLFINVGTISENPKQNGLTNLTQTLLLKGTKKRTALQIAEKIDRLGAILNQSAGDDYSEVYTVANSDDIYIALDLLAECVFSSTFPQEELVKAKRNILSYIKLREDDKFYLCYKELKKKLFQGHSYSMPVYGTEETVPVFTREHVAEHYARQYYPGNMILSVVGNFSERKMISKIKKSFGRIHRTANPTLLVSKDFRKKAKNTTLSKKIEQTFIIVGYLGTKIGDKDYCALKIASAVLGSGMSSRLFTELRDERGLGYVVGAAAPSRRAVSPFLLYIGVKPERSEEAKRELLEQVSRLRSEQVSDEELDRAKNYLIGRFFIDHQTNRKQSWYLGFYETMGLGYQYDELYPQLLEKVTKQDVRRVARKYLEYPTISILKPEDI